MTYQELLSLSEQERKARLKATQEELYKLSLTHAAFPLEKPHRLRALRREVARIATALRQDPKTSHGA